MVRNDNIANSIDIAKNVISKIEEYEFDTHTFIEKYAHDYEFEYLQDVFNCTKAKNIFRECHRKIGKFLKYNQTAIGISDLEKKAKSKSIFGNKVPNEVWRKN